MDTTKKSELVVLGGGCFWCIEAVFERIPGVISVTSGYAGGELADPSYEQVSSGTTGHAEVVQLEYNPEKISFDKIMDLFFAAHDPSTENRQGADIGSQYRSIILYTDSRQRAQAEEAITKVDRSGHFPRRVVTELKPLESFWPAEEYHQDYYEHHPYAGYCRVIIAPKLDKLGLTIDALIK